MNIAEYALCLTLKIWKGFQCGVFIECSLRLPKVVSDTARVCSTVRDLSWLYSEMGTKLHVQWFLIHTNKTVIPKSTQMSHKFPTLLCIPK